MASTSRFGHVQMKALFFVILLAGNEAVRVTQEVQWPKSKWNELHEDCTWSLKGCQGEGCAWKRFPLDTSPSSSCRHTDAYLLEHDGLKNFRSMLNLLEDKSAKYARSCHGASVFNRKCKRREAQMFDALKFIARAPADEKFQSQLSNDEMHEVMQSFEKTFEAIFSSVENGQIVKEPWLCLFRAFLG